MPNIQRLSESLINKIAAGEVIERPSSVVKELLENSIDAGSTDIRAEIIKGGKKLIRISDNGTGMDRDDALLCLERHATSKLASEEELFRISTMGFRGEALSSIAAVSKISLTTGLRGEHSGTQVETLGGEIKTIKDASSVGTTIEVRDLFFNTPVRRKFLRTDHTELYHIIDVITRAAIINPEMSFSLKADGRGIFNCSRASGMKERILQIYGMEFVAGLKEVGTSGKESGIAMEGFISRQGNVRRTRAHQYLFVNKRPVSDGALRHAVYKAYEGFIAKEDHPVFFLSLRISPSTVDVNVHPAKKEIRFLDREEVYHFMLHSVRDALSEGKKDNEKTDSPHSDLRSVGGYPEPFSLNRSAQFPGEAGESGISFAVSESQELFCNTAGQFMYLGDVFAAYHDAGRLCIIDHHAAHERILYEKLKNGIGLDSYRLLFPRQVRLSAKEYSVILEYRKVFETMGMEIEDFGGNTVIVRTLPSVLDEKEMGSLLSDLALRIMDVCANSPLDIVRDEIAKKMACHSSVRGPRLLGNEKLDALIHDLEETDDPHHCPHGRPTRICFSLDDLRKLFERK